MFFFLITAMLCSYHFIFSRGTVGSRCGGGAGAGRDLLSSIADHLVS